jgi:hypothetical protein
MMNRYTSESELFSGDQAQGSFYIMARYLHSTRKEEEMRSEEEVRNRFLFMTEEIKTKEKLVVDLTMAHENRSCLQ